MEIFLWLLGLCFLTIITLNWWVGRSESEVDYLITGRDRPWWHIAFSKYAAAIGAAYYVTYTAYAIRLWL